VYLIWIHNKNKFLLYYKNKKKWIQAQDLTFERKLDFEENGNKAIFNVTSGKREGENDEEGKEG